MVIFCFVCYAIKGFYDVNCVGCFMCVHLQIMLNFCVLMYMFIQVIGYMVKFFNVINGLVVNELYSAVWLYLYVQFCDYEWFGCYATI